MRPLLGRRIPEVYLTVAGIFLLARLATFVIAWLVMVVRPEQGFTEILTDWDGNWNEIVARDLYQPLSGSDPNSILRWSSLAFFPLLPVTTRIIHEMTGIGIHILGPAISMVAGFVGFILLARIIHEKFGANVTGLSIAFMLFSPSGFVFSMFYTEGPTILLVALTMKRLDEGKWLRAGLFAALGGLTRPSGFVLVVPCAVAAISHIRKNREQSRSKITALAAPVIACSGFLSWIAFVAFKTRTTTGYFEIQSQAWGARIDMGVTYVREFASMFNGVGGNIDSTVSILAVLVIGFGGLFLGWRQKLPGTWQSLAFTLVIVTVFNARQASGARFLLPAFPLFVAWARFIPRQMVSATVGFMATIMGGLFVLSVAFWKYTP
jgi:hypothetical protein